MKDDSSNLEGYFFKLEQLLKMLVIMSTGQAGGIEIEF